MRNKISETTSPVPLGFPPGRKLLEVPSGPLKGRLVAIFQSAPGDIAYSFSDYPHAHWSPPTIVTSDGAPFPFDAVIDPNGHIQLVYCTSGQNDLVTRRLTLSGDDWLVGSAIAIYNADSCFASSITYDLNGVLWVAWSMLDTGFYDIQVKNSSDSGQTWGSGSADMGTTLKVGLSAGMPKILTSATRVFVGYVGNLTDLYVRSRPLTEDTWTEEFVVANGSNIDREFDMALSAHGSLAFAFDDDGVRFREFDGNNWSSLIDIDARPGRSPQILYAGTVPIITYLVQLENGMTETCFVERRSGKFSDPAILEPAACPFDGVILFSTTSSTYADLTGPAADSSPADIYHPDSNSLLSDQGDALYLGMSCPFRNLRAVLSTVGSGGSLSFSYWDGWHWKAFTPVTSGSTFDLTEESILLWVDLASIPKDWQRSSVHNRNLYWIRIDAVSSFSINPVGSRITAYANIQALSVRR